MYDKNIVGFENLFGKEVDGLLIAGGPSLKDTDLSLYRDKMVYFSVSLTYKADFVSDYHFIGDMNIVKQFSDEIRELETVGGLFVSNGIYGSGILTGCKSRLLYWYGNSQPGFYIHPYQGLHGGGTSTFIAMQMAYFMGIRNLYCVGLDHYKDLDKQLEQTKIVGRNKNSNLVEVIGEDINHFTSDFYPKGTKFFVPQIDRMAESYEMARLVYEYKGRKLMNASLETELSEEVLPRIDYDSLND